MSRDSEFKSPSNQTPLLLVPEGLSRCPVCNEYRGVISPSGISRFEDDDPSLQIVVSCVCEGILCPTCNKNRIHRPLSNTWVEEVGLYQMPLFSASIPCDECLAKQRAESAAAEQAKKADCEFKTLSAETPLLPVPKGLSQCSVCNEYRGTMGFGLAVDCICNGILCRRCQKNRVHRPISNVWDPRGGFGHIPYFAAQIPCDDCRRKEKEEEAAGLRKRSTGERRIQAEEDDPETDDECFKANWDRRKGRSEGIQPGPTKPPSKIEQNAGEIRRQVESKADAGCLDPTHRYDEQARIYQQFEEQFRSAMADSRHAEARALIESTLKSIPLDWEPIREQEDCVIGAFWDEEEFLAYKEAHRDLVKPLLWVPPSQSKLWWLMGAVDAAERQYGSALVCLLNAWEYEPDHPRIWIAKGNALNWQDRFAEALDAYRTAVGVRSWTPPTVLAKCYHGQGVALGGMRRLPEARDAFARAVELDPDNDRARGDLACVVHDLRELRKRMTGGGPTYRM